MPQAQQCQIQASSEAYTTVQGNARSLTHWVRPRIKPATSWFLLGFVSAAPQQELQSVSILYVSSFVSYFIFSLFLSFFFFFFRASPQHREVPIGDGESELQLLAYTTATATWDLSLIWDLWCHSLWQRWIFNPLSEARDWICILTDTNVGFLTEL